MSSGNGYEVLCRVTNGDIFPVTKYKTKTGITVYICEAPGAAIYGYLTFGTMALDNDGLMKILQHLVRCGSELYPYKGLLQKMAKFCFEMQFIDSFDCLTHESTSYAMATFGAEGFLKLLPVYLDYVLYPTLTDDAFLTTVYHIDSEGKDGGEMCNFLEYVEYDGPYLCSLEMTEVLYPENCGFRYPVCGRIKNLRESVTIEKVRDYHKKFYRPDNLCIIVNGQIDVNDFFKVLSSFEERIIEKNVSYPQLIRPWLNPVPSLKESMQKVVYYPTQYEETGLVSIAWLGPQINEIMEIKALNVLLKYLTDGSTSPLMRDFVQIESYCSEVSASLDNCGQTDLVINFDGVGMDKLLDIKARLLEILSNIATGKEQLKMETISNIIRKEKLSIFDELESAVHVILPIKMVHDFLYGQSVSDLERRMQPVQVLNELAKKDNSYWQNLVKKHFLDKNSVTIIGKPSSELQKKLIEEDKNRIKEQKENLGEAGLKKKELELKQANEKNEIEIPEELFVPKQVLSLDLKLYPVVRITNCVNDPNYDSRLKDMPCCFQLDDIKTNFVTFYVLMDTSTLPLKLRLYIPIYLWHLMRLPIIRNEEEISRDDMEAQLEKDTIEKNYICGINEEEDSWLYPGVFSQLIGLQLKVEEEKYEKGIQWLHELLYKSIFTLYPIQSYIDAIIEVYSERKLHNFTALKCMVDSIYYSKECTHWSNSVFRQLNYIKKIANLIDSNPEEVRDDLEMLRSKLTDPENVLVHMTCNLQNLGENALSCWKKFIEPSPQRQFIRHKIKRTEDLVLPLASSVSLSCIYGIEDEERITMRQMTRGVDSWHHADYPALLVGNDYFIQQTCPLRNKMEKFDASNNYSIRLKEDVGMIQFEFICSENFIPAYKRIKKYIYDLVNGEEQWDEKVLILSKSFVIHKVCSERNSSVRRVSHTSLQDYYKGIDTNFTRTLVEKILKITVDDLIQVGKKYLLPLFDLSQSSCAIVCGKPKMEEIIAEFKELSCNLSVITDIDHSFVAHIDDDVFDK